MIITFCGHSKLAITEEIEQKLEIVLINILEKNYNCEFYLGQYGHFDLLCHRILLNLKNKFKTIKIIFVTPYIYGNYSKLKYIEEFDEIIYPPLELVPPKFAIAKRNEWMVDKSDIIIAYVKHEWGGASRTLNYAKMRNKHIINLVH